MASAAARAAAAEEVDDDGDDSALEEGDVTPDDSVAGDDAMDEGEGGDGEVRAGARAPAGRGSVLAGRGEQSEGGEGPLSTGTRRARLTRSLPLPAQDDGPGSVREVARKERERVREQKRERAEALRRVQEQQNQATAAGQVRLSRRAAAPRPWEEGGWWRA